MKRLLKKVAATLKRKGFVGAFKAGLKFLKYRLLMPKKRRLVLDNLLEPSKFSNIIVFENNFGWSRLMKQRPQQIAEGLPPDTLMFYHTSQDEDFDNKDRITLLKDNLILIDLGYYRKSLMDIISPCENKFLMIYSTDYIEYKRIDLYIKSGYSVIYEYVDDINRDLMGDEMYELLLERHNKLVARDGISVVCTASELQKKLDVSALLVTNGVDYKKFRFEPHPVPEDLLPIKEKFETVVCYYGALASWFDYDLVKLVARETGIAVVLIGIDYDGTLEKSKITSLENVFYLGKKPYDELPAYGCNCDILTIPFVINDITKATSPVKIFEYMAMERPIVTTDLPECRKYNSVLISKTTNDFINNIRLAKALASDSDYIETERREAMENDWSMKAEALINYAKRSKNAAIDAALSEAGSSSFDRIVIWRSPFGWNVPLFQRPQHIARQMAKKNCLVFYEVTTATDDVAEIKKEEDNLFLVNFASPASKRRVEEFALSCGRPAYIQFYSTNWSMSLDEVKCYMDAGFKPLYEYIDDISPELAGTDEVPENILAKYRYIMENTNIPVVTTARRLYDDVKSKRGEENLIFACNGVDYPFFTTFDREICFNDEFLKVIKNGKTNICYYGALASWFDYKLIREISDISTYNVILFGIPYDSSFKRSKIEKLPNVHYFGPIDYSDLKYYAAKMDILIIPFVINSITLATSPLKLFEYMALHKPIVTTAMDECKNYKSVLTANDHEEFIEKLTKAKALINDRDYVELLDSEARKNDWSSKADAIIEKLKENE